MRIFDLKWSYSICQSINQGCITPVCCFMFSFGRLVSSVLPADGFLPPNHLLLHKGPTWSQPFGTISSSLFCPKVDLHDIERPISSPQSGGWRHTRLGRHKCGLKMKRRQSKDLQLNWLERSWPQEPAVYTSNQTRWQGVYMWPLPCIHLIGHNHASS